MHSVFINLCMFINCPKDVLNIMVPYSVYCLLAILYNYYPTAESRTVFNTTSFLGVTSSPSQTSMGLNHTNVLIIAICVSAGFLLMLLVVILVTTVLLFGRHSKQKRGIITTVVHVTICIVELRCILHFYRCHSHRSYSC